MFIDFGVSRDRLGHFRDGVVIPVVLSAVANKQTPTGFKLTNEVLRFTEASALQVFVRLVFRRW